MIGTFLRKTVGHWTLERKSLLFFGTALFVSICASFWFVQRVADKLVMLTTRQAARDYAHTVLLWTHVEKYRKESPPNSLSSSNKFSWDRDLLTLLKDSFINTSSYQSKFVALDPVSQHNLLPDAPLPESEAERDLLINLEQEVRTNLANASKVAVNPADGLPADSTAKAPGEESAKSPALHPDLEKAFVRSATNAQPSFREAGPLDDKYVYYHPVSFQRRCFDCHYPKKSGMGLAESFDLAKDAPFVAMKVIMPYEATHVASLRIQALMIALAMVTLAGTLVILHLILRRLVIKPLRHLRDVSEEISGGRYDLRAEIDSNDEFNDLADAFNRMLRHLTDSQGQLRNLNVELDKKVDQLAQANLHLYEANRLKSDFLANMSHELRTPLNSIIGFSDVLQDISSLTDKQKRYAANIQKSGRMLLEMINDILDLAKIEAGKLEVKPTLFDLNQIVQAQCDMMRSLSEAKNIDVQVQMDSALDTIYQDQPKIQQILTNLLSNAIKFTPEGGLITIATGCVGEEHLIITVADTGVGIPESDFDIIFEKFRQSNAILEGGDNLTRQYSGTGLGLSIVKELCKLLGGEIALSSHVGKGSTFRVKLPRNYAPTSLPKDPSEVLASSLTPIPARAAS